MNMLPTLRMPMLVVILLAGGLISCANSQSTAKHAKTAPAWFVDGQGDTIRTINRSDEEWKKTLDPLAYDVLREKGTERAFTGPLNANKAKGVYACAACQLTLFSSDAKFDSGSGWPSYFQPLSDTVLSRVEDFSHGMHRIEVKCAKCDAHLGHVFPDGPRPTGLRYCINSVSLNLVPRA